MKKILIGFDANSDPIYLTPEQRYSSHMHVIGGTRTGKSKFLEWLVRRDLKQGQGLCVLDWHGRLYQDVLDYCAQLRIGVPPDWRNLILLNPCKPDFITGYNPFMYQGPDVSVQVQRRIDAVIRPWGITDTNLMPTFERVCRVIFTVAVEQQQPLWNIRQLLRHSNADLRAYAHSVLKDQRALESLEDLQEAKSRRDFREEVLSADNRLGRFLGSQSVRRHMGLPKGNIDLMDIMDNQKILLVNLGSSDFLDRESARVFASLLLYDFFDTAMRRAQIARDKGLSRPDTFVLYMDEFQEYITEDIAAMLDQVLKGGLHIVLAHQHLGHLIKNPELRKSIFTNARIRAVFGGLDYEDSTTLANEMFLDDLNSRQVKKAYYHTIHLYREETRTIHSSGTSSSRGTGKTQSRGSGSSRGEASSRGGSQNISSGFSRLVDTDAPPVLFDNTEGWFSEGEGSNQSSARASSRSDSDFYGEGDSEQESHSESETVTEVPVFVPIPKEELTTEAEWTREEKVSRVAEILTTQMQRHCFIKLDREKTQPLLVPPVREFRQSPTSLLEYEDEVYQAQGALPASQVDAIIAEREQQFLTTARAAIEDVIDISPEPEREVELIPRRSRKKPSKPIKPNAFDVVDPYKDD